MDKAVQTMIDNLHQNTGKSLEEWVKIVKKQNLAKHGEMVKFLKTEHGFTHGFANLVAMTAREAGSLSADLDALIEEQYKGKEHFKSLYEQLMSEIKGFGSDVEVAPKKAYVSLRRKKQFATLNPATKSRFEVGINLKGQAPEGKLEAEKPNAMCSHKICLTGTNDINDEVLGWIQTAYENAG